MSVPEEKDKKGRIPLETGGLSWEEVQAVLNTLPVDVTFIDKDDTVRYFNKFNERIFARPKEVIGRSVQDCHPKNSLHVVNKLIEDFKNRRRNAADFWINLQDKLVYIRYFPVRDGSGEYIGCLEVSQDVTDIKKLEGEKRLLDAL